MGKHPGPTVPGGNAPASRGATQTPGVDSRIVSTRENKIYFFIFEKIIGYPGYPAIHFASVLKIQLAK